MKIGIFTALFGDKSLTETLDIVKAEGIQAVEFGAGAYPGAAHLEVEKLLTAVDRERADTAIGSRALDRSLVSVHQSAIRELSGQFFNLVMRAVVRLPFRDTQCGFKLFRRQAAQEIFSRVRIDGFGFDVEALFIARKRGFKTVEVPVRWANVEGTKIGLANGMNAFIDFVDNQT